MAGYLLDTDICIHAIKAKDAGLRAKFSDNHDALAISTVTLSELLYGAEKSARPERNRRVVKDFAARVDVLGFDHECAAHTGDIRAALARLGTPIGAYDVMIAATARAHGLIMVTNNIREFERVDGLRVETWIPS